MSEPRELTGDEVRDIFLDRVWEMVDYWNEESRVTNPRDKLSGLAFSILAMLDGSNIGIPAFRICPDPHPDDKEYRREQGENWFPDNADVELKGEITTLPLHEFFHQRDPRNS